MPKVESTVTLGNLLSIATMLISAITIIVAIAIAWGRMETRVAAIDERARATAVAVDASESRIRILEAFRAATDTRLASIEQLLRDGFTRIDRRLERMEERAPAAP